MDHRVHLEASTEYVASHLRSHVYRKPFKLEQRTSQASLVCLHTVKKKKNPPVFVMSLLPSLCGSALFFIVVIAQCCLMLCCWDSHTAGIFVGVSPCDDLMWAVWELTVSYSVQLQNSGHLVLFCSLLFGSFPFRYSTAELLYCKALY